MAILVIDAEEGITEQDAKIAGIAHERRKGMIIAVNKWDLIEYPFPGTTRLMKFCSLQSRIRKKMKDQELQYGKPNAGKFWINKLLGEDSLDFRK